MNNKILGQLAEEAASLFLKKRGYIIIERNFKNNLGEIDIIAVKPGNFLQYIFRNKILSSSRIVFVEVKASSSKLFGYAEERINHFKKQKLVKLAYSYMKEKHLFCGFQIDAIRVHLLPSGKLKIKHIESAVEENGVSF